MADYCYVVFLISSGFSRDSDVSSYGSEAVLLLGAQLPHLHVATNTSKHNIDMCQRQATIKIH